MNKNINLKLDELFLKHDRLLELTHNFFYSNNLDELMYDTLAIDNTKEFTKYKRDTSLKIIELTQNLLNEEKVLKLFKVRERLLDRYIENFNVDKIGTILNILREFWNDILIDLKRNII